MEKRLIDADELLEKAEYISTGFKSRGMQVCFYGVTAATIENAPTIDPESLRPHGKWVKEPFSSRCVCTNCKSVFPEWIRVYNYCPFCGARMMEKEAAKFIQAFGEMMKNETKVD